jgi:hypothetical protein
MSSTRHAAADSPLRQERYASSPEFERGLLATAVARRCAVIDDAADRELIWWLHFMSHQPGGLKALTVELIAKFADRIGTRQMLRIGKRTGTYSADQLREVRKDLPDTLKRHFLMRGEALDYHWAICDVRKLITYEEMMSDEAESRLAESDKQPTSYPVADFINFFREVAESGSSMEHTDSLEDHIRKLCLDPGIELATSAPWYFEELLPTLRAHMSAWIAQRGDGVVVTALGSKVHETLDYTLHSRTMSLMVGDARTGKSFSARSWCEQHPGCARFVEVPTGNDQKDFFRALALGLGLGSFQQYKAGEIRAMVESMLITGDILLCLDEAHRLWPQMNLRYGFPKRVEWLMSMANQGVPICLVATPQFIDLQKAVEQTGWNSAQFIGRLGHYEPLPRELELDDLTAVARSVLPEADKPTLRALAAYARTSARYLAAIDTISKRARYIAQREGRDTATTADVRKAMTESVVPSDSKIASALQALNRPGQRGDRNVVANKLPATQPALSPAPRATTPEETAEPIIPRHRFTGSSAELLGKE